MGSNNNAAQVTALAVAESPGETYNPLYIYGGVGLGKTHLLQAIGNFVLEQNPEATVLYTYSESFVNEVIDLLAGKHTVQEDIQRFRNKYRNVDVLLLDDIQFFSNKDRCQEDNLRILRYFRFLSTKITKVHPDQWFEVSNLINQLSEKHPTIKYSTLRGYDKIKNVLKQNQDERNRH